MRQINRNLFPRDGFHYKESDGVTIRGDTWAGVIQRVVNYRARNHLPPGNPEQEVMNQACDRNPGYCTDENQAYKTEVVRASLKNRVLIWLLQMRTRKEKENLAFVNDQDAHNRVQVCAGCPHNQALPSGCATCKQAVEESRRQLVGSRFSDARVNSCAVLGEEINTSMHFDLLREDNPALPGHCWRKRILG
jgi:hypothetical protein